MSLHKSAIGFTATVILGGMTFFGHDANAQEKKAPVKKQSGTDLIIGEDMQAFTMKAPYIMQSDSKQREGHKVLNYMDIESDPSKKIIGTVEVEDDGNGIAEKSDILFTKVIKKEGDVISIRSNFPEDPGVGPDGEASWIVGHWNENQKDYNYQVILTTDEDHKVAVDLDLFGKKKSLKLSK